MTSVEFVVPWLGPSLNEIYNSRHWSILQKHKRNAAIAVMVGINEIRWKGELEFPVIISIRPLLGKGRRRYDMVNYALTYKIIEDCLVAQGVLPDDSGRYVSAFQIEQPERIAGIHSATRVHIFPTSVYIPEEK